MNSLLRSLRRSGGLALLGTAAVFSASFSAARAQTGTSPAARVPQARWGTLEPRQILGDTTFYTFNYEPGCNEPFWFDIDMEGGLLFTVTGSTFEIWDTRTNGAAPSRSAEMCKPVLTLWKKTDVDFYAVHVAVAPAATSGALPQMAVVGLEGGMGVVAIDVSDPSSPARRYQNDDVSVLSLDATRINGRDYAIVSRNTNDIALYDLSSAAALNSCSDRQGVYSCGVFLGTLTYEDQKLAAASNIVAAGRFLVVREASGAVVYDLAPALAGNDLRLVAEVSPRPSTLDAWVQGGELYFATTDGTITDLFHVPCAFGTGSCAAVAVLPTPLSTPGGLAPNGTTVIKTNTLTYSEDAGSSYLYVGSTNIPGGGPQREYLFDLSNLANPTELTPQGHPDGYWGWYYEPNPTGFRHVAPRTAMVHDGYLYRSGYSILDVHELVGSQPPVARFDLPQGTVLGGQTVQFTDRSVRGPTAWEWRFLDGQQLLATDTDRHPTWTVPETPTYPHQYRVSLKVSNLVGDNTLEKTLTVYDPVEPPLEITAFRPLLFCPAWCEATVGTPVAFILVLEGTAESYDYDWDGDGTFEDSGHDSPIDTHSYQQPGNYRPIVRVTAAQSQATSQIDKIIQVAFDPATLVLIDDFEGGDFSNWSSVR